MKSKKILIIAILIIAAILFCFWQNNSIVVSKYNYKNDNIPNAFNGVKILQVSDLHNKEFGENHKSIINKIKEISPDIILITGDLIDRRRYDLESASRFIDEIVKIAPVYYVSGNHEAWSGKYEEIKKLLIDKKVKVLDNDMIVYKRDKESIKIIGARDPAFLNSKYSDEINTSEIKSCLSSLTDDKEFKILLSHRPELMELYKKYNMDLVFSGHTHGGQIRLPFIGGVVVPNQGFFLNMTLGDMMKKVQLCL